VIVPSYHYMIGPMSALLALGVIVLICRWVFSTAPRDRRTAERRARVRARGDYGLLVPVATTRTAGDADLLRGLLRDAGVRCTVTAGSSDSPAQPGTWQLLVFRADAERASALVRH
jgi:hypothetical protein